MMKAVPEISPDELRSMREQGAPHQLIDLRETYETELCSIGGTPIPMAQIVERLDELRRDVPVVVHCRTGGRGAAVAQALSTRYGFSNVFNLRGGIVAYSEEVDSNIFCD